MTAPRVTVGYAPLKDAPPSSRPKRGPSPFASVVMLDLLRRQDWPERPVATTVPDLARRLDLPERTLRRALDQLAAIDLVRSTYGPDGALEVAGAGQLVEVAG